MASGHRPPTLVAVLATAPTAASAGAATMALTVPAHGAEASGPSGKRAVREAVTGQRTASRTTVTATDGPGRLTAAGAVALDCATVRHTTLQDRVVLHTGGTGASSVTVDRRRQGGTTVRLATLSGSQAVYVDRRIASAALSVYTLRFSFADGTSKTCAVEANDVSPDDLLVANDGAGQIHAVQAPEWSESGFTPLASRDSYTPSASADGRFMAYAAVPGRVGDLDLFLRRTDGLGAGAPLPSTDADDLEPAFSHDGRRLAYTSLDGSTSRGLTVVGLVTGAARSVPNSAGLAESSWTPDGRLLTTDLTSDAALLVFIHPDTGARSTLSGSAGGWAPDVSDQGVVAYAALSTDGRAQIRRHASGSTSVRTTLDTGRSVVDLSWSHHSASDGYSYPGGSLFFIDGRIDTSGRYESLVRTLTPSGPAFAAFPDRPVTWLDARRVLRTGTSDLTGDGLNDLLARDGAGVLWVYPSSVQTGEQILGPRVRVGAGWGPYFVVGTGDLDGDLAADVLARDASGRLWLYPGTGTGGRGAPAFDGRREVGKGWNVMNALVGAGDVDYDGRPDLLARDRSTGVLWLYPGNATGGLAGRRSMGTGWEVFNAFAGVENVTFPHSRNGLMVRTIRGELEWHPSQGDGQIPANLWWQQTTGWGSYTLTG